MGEAAPDSIFVAGVELGLNAAPDGVAGLFFGRLEEDASLVGDVLEVADECRAVITGSRGAS